MGFWLGTLLFFLIEVVVALSINLFSRNPKNGNGLNHLLAGTAIVQAWSLWAIFWVAQLHPLIQPGKE